MDPRSSSSVQGQETVWGKLRLAEEDAGFYGEPTRGPRWKSWELLTKLAS